LEEARLGRSFCSPPLDTAPIRRRENGGGRKGAEKEAYELGRVLEELPPGALGLGHPDRRHHLLPPAPLQAAAAENKLLTVADKAAQAQATEGGRRPEGGGGDPREAVKGAGDPTRRWRTAATRGRRWRAAEEARGGGVWGRRSATPGVRPRRRGGEEAT